MLKSSAICSTVLCLQSSGSNEGENMDAPLQDCTIEEQRGVVRFLWAQVSLLPKETALRHVLRWCNLTKERPCFRPRCCQPTDGRALFCKWLNSSTGIVNTVQCTSSSLSRLPRNLKIAFTYYSPSYH